MEFTLRWTPEDIWEAHWLILKKRQYAAFVLPAILLLGCAMMSLAILLIVRDEAGSGIFFLAFSLFLIVGSVFYKRWRLWRFGKIPESKLSSEISLSDEGVRAKTPEAEGFIKWEAFGDWWDDERIIVLIRKDKSLSYMFPTRQLSSDQLQQLRVLVASKIAVKP